MSSQRAEPIPEDFKLFRALSPGAVPASAPPELPDSYFTPTAADLKNAQTTLAARTQALTNAPLQLRAVREAEVKAKRDRWPEARIRIKFTDRTQLEKVFPASSKIRVVYAFVRSCLRDDVKPIKFILCASSLLLYFLLRSAEMSDVSSHCYVDSPAPLSDFVLSQAVDLPIPVPPAEPEPAAAAKKKPAPSASGSAGKSSGSGEVKVPKWLKLKK
ncbi:hypothetical protein D9619_004605 [Psilocybe cf. subviscida]|uniref:UBX domain-containing protein n=1 Tax=Psilocybe cf. subviscida TaxID=2480587 RepID=A0A8H5BPX7_9AGAR|nr:hypothetical protein D9619_004605 [Psilocybe cf. subviscida]